MTTAMQAPSCAISPRDKKNQAQIVGDDLVNHHGKRNFYSVQQVRDANSRCSIKPDYACWSHALFNTRDDFERLHIAAGEACDYLAMKKEMLASLSSGDSSDWFDFDLSWLDFPDVDWSIFDFFDL